MVTGKRPFVGKSQISLASAILEKDPDPISATSPLITPALEHVIKTCLQKDPEDRYLAAHDIKLELKWIATGRSSSAVPASQAETSHKQQRFAWIAAIIAAIVLDVVAGFFINRPAQSAQSIRTVVDPPEKVPFHGGQGKWQVSTTEGSQPKWSRDGKELYYANDISRVLSAVPVSEVNGALQFGAAKALVTAPATQQFIYDVSPDGKKILLNVVSQQVNQSVTVITNFTAGLRK
jgi:serine/threonine protein kinase